MQATTPPSMDQSMDTAPKEFVLFEETSPSTYIMEVWEPLLVKGPNEEHGVPPNCEYLFLRKKNGENAGRLLRTTTPGTRLLREVLK